MRLNMKQELFFIFLLLAVHRSEGFSEVFGFVTTVVDGIMDLVGESEEGTFDGSEIISEITAQIKTSEKRLYEKVTLQAQFSKLEEDLLNINNALVDVLHLSKSPAKERKHYINKFLESSEDAIKHARFLPQRLQETVPGIHNYILQYISERSRCDMTTINEFTNFLINMVINGMIIEFTSVQLNNQLNNQNSTLDSEEEFWNKSLQTLERHFQKQEESCKAKFKVLITEDIQNAVNAETLQKDIERRYTWIWNAVFMFKAEITDNQFYNDGNPENLLSMTNNGLTKLVVYASRNNPRNKTSREDELDNRLDSLLPVGLVNSAKIVAISIKSHLCGLNFTVESIVAYSAGRNTAVNTTVDTGSQMKMTTLKTEEREFMVYILMGESDGGCVEYSNNVAQGVSGASTINHKCCEILVLVLLMVLFV